MKASPFSYMFPNFHLYVSVQLPEPEDMTEADKEKLEILREMYVENNLSVKEICKHFDAPFDNKIQKLFCQVFKSPKGHGGARKNAGNKKGYSFASKKNI